MLDPAGKEDVRVKRGAINSMTAWLHTSGFQLHSSWNVTSLESFYLSINYGCIDHIDRLRRTAVVLLSRGCSRFGRNSNVIVATDIT